MMSAMASVASAHDGADRRRDELLPSGWTITSSPTAPPCGAGAIAARTVGPTALVVEVDPARAGGDARGELFAGGALGEGLDLQPGGRGGKLGRGGCGTERPKQQQRTDKRADACRAHPRRC